MSKRLVVCCDGTWNFPDQQCPTNVTKVALAIAPVDSKGTEQRTFYHRGIGSNRPERIRGGAFGFGLSRDVRDTYRFLVQNYEPGDELFFFGFSRGAFTARSTVGLVRNAGILRPSHGDRVGEGYALYRSRTKTNTPRGREATLFRRSYSYEPRIRFIGVWDTVGALGIPLDGFRLISRLNRRWEFHDAELSSSVDAAYQALAIDARKGMYRLIPRFHRRPDFSTSTCQSIASSAVTRRATDPTYAPPKFTDHLDNAEHRTAVEAGHSPGDAQPRSDADAAARTSAVQLSAMTAKPISLGASTTDRTIATFRRSQLT